MPNPWEEYQDQPSPEKPQKMPWEEFGPTPLAERREKPVVNEMHPDISAKDRFLYKNFGVDPVQSFNFLQKKYPKLRMKRDNQGNLLIRRPEEKEWRKLDPAGVDLQDISDIAYDIPAGLAETAAAAAGGVGGGLLGLGGVPAALVTVPLGAAAGAASAGAAAGAATETARQGLGKLFGVAEEMDTGQIGFAAGAGALSPLLLGTGAAGKRIVKAATKKSLVNKLGKEGAEEAVELIAQAQRSVLGRGAGKLINATTPNLAAWASGYKAKAMVALREKVASGLMSVNPAEIPRAFRDDMVGAIKAKKDILGKAYGESLEALDVVVDSDMAEKPFRDLMSKYYEKAIKVVPDFEAQMLEGVVPDVADVKNYLHLKDSIMPYLRKGDKLDGADIVGYLDNLNDLTKIRKNINAQGLSKVDQDLIRVSKQVAGEVDGALDKTILGQEFKNVKSQYKEIYESEEMVKKYLKDDKSAESSLRNLDSEANFTRKEELTALGEKYGVDVEDYANESYLLSQFFEPAEAAKHMRGTSATLRSVPLAAATGAAGYAVAQESGIQSPFLTAMIAGAAGTRLATPAMLRRYANVGNVARQASQGAQNISPIPQATLNIWQQLQERK